MTGRALRTVTLIIFRFFNSLWLVANDVIIGIALGSYIIDNAPWVAWQINEVLNGWTVDGLRDMILWLMDWPAGLKLNTELAQFLGDLFLWVIDVWKGEIECRASSDKVANSLRICRQPHSSNATYRIFHRLCQLCRSHHAHLHDVRSSLTFGRYISIAFTLLQLEYSIGNLR